MSIKPRKRPCPRCDALVEVEPIRESEVGAYMWRCGCGWSRLFTQSGIVDRSDKPSSSQPSPPESDHCEDDEKSTG